VQSKCHLISVYVAYTFSKRFQSNLKEMEQYFCEEWAKIPVARCAKIIETYPKRVAAVTVAKAV